MECKDCKFYTVLENGHHGQCVVVPEKHIVVHPYSCQCTEFEKKEEVSNL